MATTKTTTTSRAMRPSVRPITASTTSGTTRTTTSTSPSTTPMTMLTSTIAWCTRCVERARRAHSFTLDVVSHLIGSSPESHHNHLYSHPWRTLFDSLLPFYIYLFFPVLFFSFHLLHSELYSELDNPIVMESLCYSANKESEDAYDVSTSLTGYEPNFVTFGGLNDSSVSVSFMIPSSDQDMDDVTLGKLLTEAHRGQADYCEPEGVSVSQSSSSVVFDGSGNLMEREMSINQLILVSQGTRTVLTASFLKTPELRKWSMDQGNLMSETARTHRLGLYLKSRDR